MSTAALDPDRLNQGKRSTLILLIGILAVMISLVVASPTLYKIFCQVTGYGGTARQDLQVYERPEAQISGLAVHDQAFQVSVAAEVSGDAPIVFTTTSRKIENFKIGQRLLLNFSVTNTSDAPITAQAIHQIDPPVVAAHMQVQECFCTSEQVLEPGKTYEYTLVMRFIPEAADSSDVLRTDAIQVRYEYLEKS